MPGSGPIDPDKILFNLDGEEHLVDKSALDIGVAYLPDDRLVKILIDGSARLIEPPRAVLA